MIQYYIGLMLASSATNDSGIAVIDKNNEVILLDKLFTMQDIQHFFDNFSSLKHSQISISLPTDNTLLVGKWRLMYKFYQTVGLGKHILNRNNWTQRFSTRGCDYFKTLAEKDIKINRYDIPLTREALHLSSCFKDRSPADSKALQSALRMTQGFETLPMNMLPMAQLEALVGAILSKRIVENIADEKPIFEFNGMPVFRK